MVHVVKHKTERGRCKKLKLVYSKPSTDNRTDLHTNLSRRRLQALRSHGSTFENRETPHIVARGECQYRRCTIEVGNGVYFAGKVWNLNDRIENLIKFTIHWEPSSFFLQRRRTSEESWHKQRNRPFLTVQLYETTLPCTLKNIPLTSFYSKRRIKWYHIFTSNTTRI